MLSHLRDSYFIGDLLILLPNGKFSVSKSRTPMGISVVRGHLTADHKQGMPVQTGSEDPE